MKLKISPDLSLPLDFVTSTQAILAKKGKGKSYTASVQAEELLDAHQQVVVVDPTGAWWGLRSSADGKSSGYPIAVLGGEHADVPLEATAGEVIGDAIAAEHFSCVLDLSLFRKAEANRFMGVLLETLYRKNRDALHLFIDEADTVAPQKPFGDEARTLGACEDIVRRGRIRGIGCTLITQRAAVLNKNVLSQVDMLTTLSMNHPKDIAAIKEWVAVHGDEDQAKKMIAELPALPIGQAWIWAPASDIFERVTIRRRRTFDSGKTPKAGERAIAPKVLAPVDIARLGQTIAATVEKAKANDPRALKSRVVELEKQLAAKAPKAPKVETRTVEKPVIKNEQITRIENLHIKVDKLAERFAAITTAIATSQTELAAALRSLKAGNDAAAAKLVRRALPAPAPSVKPLREPTEGISGPQQRILDALAMLEQIGIGDADKTQLALFAKASPSSSSYSNNLSALRTAGHIDYPTQGKVTLTDAGRAVSVCDAAPSTIEELHAFVRSLVKEAKWKLLAALIEAYPMGLDKVTLADLAGASATSSSFSNNLSALRTLGLIDYPHPGSVRAEPVLFMESS